MRADFLVQLSVKRRTEFQRKSKAQGKQNRVKITAKSSLRPGTFLKGVVTRGEEVMWKEKEKAAACFLDLLQRRMNQWWQADTNPCMRVRASVCLGRSGWAHRSVVSSHLLCHTDGSVPVPQTQPLKTGEMRTCSQLCHREQSAAERSWFTDKFSYCTFVNNGPFSTPLQMARGEA